MLRLRPFPVPVGPLAPLGLSVLLASVLVGIAMLGPQASAQTPLPAPTPSMQVLDTSKPFSHEHHLDAVKIGKPLQCGSCHEMVQADGSCPKQEIRLPKHEACSSCHTANFFTPPLTICVSCHKSAAFKQKNPLKELGRQSTPLKAEFSHASHAEGGPGNCAQCHQFIKAGVEVTHPSHPNCCECHTKPDNAPLMQDCQGCHSAAKNAGRPPSKIHSFSHKSHREDPRNGQSMQCGQCHINIQQAKTLRTIAAPPMGACVQCHDGSDPGQPHPSIPSVSGSGAFHFSSCLKCHKAGSIKGVPLPASHPTDAAPPGAIQ